MTPRVLIVGCGALARELAALTRDLPNVDVTLLPAVLHNRPERITAAVTARIAERAAGYDRVFVAYADCGTGGALDRALEGTGIERIPGAHCYEFYAGSDAFARLADEEPGTFFLTDFLVRAFDRLVWQGLGLDRHPQLLGAYFGNYRRVVFLAQTDDEALTAEARRAAERLGLEFERRFTGLAPFAAQLVRARESHPDRAAGPIVLPVHDSTADDGGSGQRVHPTHNPTRGIVRGRRNVRPSHAAREARAAESAEGSWPR
jgi:hypothetical protein